MNLAATIEIYCGGPGSGCRGPDCGRKAEWKERGAKNTGTFKGEPFWSGIADSRDGSIDEIHSYEEAESNGWHHSYYVSPEGQDKMKEGDAVFFWLDAKGQVQTGWRGIEAPAKIVMAIQKQIKPRLVKVS